MSYRKMHVILFHPKGTACLVLKQYMAAVTLLNCEEMWAGKVASSKPASKCFVIIWCGWACWMITGKETFRSNQAFYSFYYRYLNMSVGALLSVFESSGINVDILYSTTSFIWNKSPAIPSIPKASLSSII